MPPSSPPLAAGANPTAAPLTVEALIDRCLPGRRCSQCGHRLRRLASGPASFICRGPDRHRVRAFAASPMSGSRLDPLLWVRAATMLLDGRSAGKIENALGLGHRIALELVDRLLHAMDKAATPLAGTVAVGIYQPPPPGPQLLAAIERPRDPAAPARLRLAAIPGDPLVRATQLLPRWLAAGAVILPEPGLLRLPEFPGRTIRRTGDLDRRLQRLSGDLEPWVRQRGGCRPPPWRPSAIAATTAVMPRRRRWTCCCPAPPSGEEPKDVTLK